MRCKVFFSNNLWRKFKGIGKDISILVRRSIPLYVIIPIKEIKSLPENIRNEIEEKAKEGIQIKKTEFQRNYWKEELLNRSIIVVYKRSKDFPYFYAIPIKKTVEYSEELRKFFREELYPALTEV